MRAKEFINEKINPDVLDPRFSHTQQIGDYTYKAFAYEGRPGVKFLRVQAFVNESDNAMDRIGDVLFRITDDERGGHLESINTFVADEYQKQGIASTMYAYAKMLGNDIQPSKDQLPPGEAMWAAWEKSGDAQHLMKEDGGNSTTLAQLYNGNYPDRDETFWDYVNSSEFNTPLTIQTLARHKVMIMLLGQYRAEHIDDVMDMLDDDRKELVQSYVDDPALSSKVIVLSGDRIIDGNHRALAAALKGVSINYVDLADLEEPEDIAEADSTSHYASEITLKLQAAGYKKLGLGADSTVWSKDDSYVIKILMPDDPNSQAEKVFQKFFEFCKQHPKLSVLPKFNEVNTIDIGGKDYTQIEMEKLTPIINNTFEEAMVWALSDMVSKNISWDNVVKELLNPRTWYGGMTRVMRKMPMFVSQRMNSPEFNKTYSQLYEVMRQLYQTGQINKFGWDLHTENVMQRSNGQLVIIDPWFITKQGSK